MHNTSVKLKNGESFSGILWSVNLHEGWFSLVGGPDKRVKIKDCASVVSHGERLSATPGHIGDKDMLKKWEEDKKYIGKGL